MAITARHCPCCGAPINPRAAHLDEEFGQVTFRGSVLLSPAQFRLLELVHRAAPRPAGRDWVLEAMSIKEATLRPGLTKLRRKIRPIGLDVEVRNGALLLVAVEPSPRPARCDDAKAVA